jgi:hypothetical protein
MSGNPFPSSSFAVASIRFFALKAMWWTPGPLVSRNSFQVVGSSVGSMNSRSRFSILKKASFTRPCVLVPR